MGKTYKRKLLSVSLHYIYKYYVVLFFVLPQNKHTKKECLLIKMYLVFIYSNIHTDCPTGNDMWYVIRHQEAGDLLSRSKKAV